MSLSGVLVLFFTILNGNNGSFIFYIFRLVVGFLFFAVGCMVRFQAALLIIPFCILCFTMFIIHNHKKGSSLRKKTFLVPFIASVTLVLVAISVNLSCSFSWSNRPEWDQYQEYNTSRSAVQDYFGNFPSWNDGKDLYSKIGVDEIDLTAIENWFTEDTNVFTTKVYQDLKEDLYFSDQNLFESLLELFYICFENPVFWILIGVLLFFSIQCHINNQYKFLLSFILSFGGSLFILLYFIILGRMQLRVMEPVLLCCIVSIFLIRCILPIEKDLCMGNIGSYSISLKKSSKVLFDKCFTVYLFPYCLYPLLFVLLIFPVWGDINNMSFSHSEDGKDYIIREKYDYFNMNSDNIYFLPVLSESWDKSFGTWERVPSDYCNNVFYLGGWPARSPYNINLLSDLNIENPVESLFNNPDVYSLNDSMIFSYLRAHYGEQITCVQTDVLPANRVDVVEKVVVKYSAPLQFEKQEKFPYDRELYISYLDSLDLYEVSVSANMDYENIYLNIVTEGKPYTFFLENKGDLEFSGFLLDAVNVFSGDIDDAYLVGRCGNNNLVYLGNVEIAVAK